MAATPAKTILGGVTTNRSPILAVANSNASGQTLNGLLDFLLPLSTIANAMGNIRNTTLHPKDRDIS
jgi:hypothetical protein